MVLAGVGVFEALMQPGPGERIGVALLFGFMAVIAAAAAMVLPRLARGQSSLRVTVVGLALVSLLVVSMGLVVAGQQMFISQHDLGLMFTVVGFGLATGLLFAVSVSRPLTDDLTRIASTASAIASGDLSARSDVVRSDEVGELAEAVDAMAVTLQRAEGARREFFAAIGHDLRTPLSSLRLAVEALEDGVAADQSRFLASMSRDVDALSRLVDDLFLLARLESGDLARAIVEVDLTEVADETIEVFRPIADERGIELRLVADRSVVVSAGPDAMARVMRNLVDNAVRHSPKGGEVVIAVSNGTEARVSVVDQGSGFTEDFAPQAFDRFSREDDARSRVTGGTGLGLAIAHGFVTHAGGHIWAEPGPGGRVGFTLPLYPLP